MSDSLKNFWQKKSEILIYYDFFKVFYKKSSKKWANRSFPLFLVSDVSKSLILLTKNEWMSESLIFFERIAHSLILGQKMSDSLGNQMSEFPALELWDTTYYETI